MHRCCWNAKRISGPEAMVFIVAARPLYILSALSIYSATREDDTTFIFSHFGLFLSDAASNSHK